jgi:hypothetical protein
MFWWLAGKSSPPFSLSLVWIILPLFVVLLCGGLATGYYYFRVTGDPFRMAYQVNRATYATAPYFLWQTPPAEPTYHHTVMRDFYRWELRDFNKNRTFVGFLSGAIHKVGLWWTFYLSPLLTLPMLAFPWVLRERKMRLPAVICGAMIAGFAVQTWTLPHYFSPATGALYILLVQCVRRVWHWRRANFLIGPPLVRAIPALACCIVLLRITAAVFHIQIEPAWPRGNLDRFKIKSELVKMRGPQLVLVSYSLHHDFDWEWVWNDADIDDSKIIWARDLGNTDNQELLNYFEGRNVWRVNGDDSPPQLKH